MASIAELQKFVDGFDAMTCVVSVEKRPEGGCGPIRIVTGNGAYLDFKRPTSWFWSAYNADPQATYSQTFPQTNGFIVGTNDYIVLRTRAVANDTGMVESAHYGKIYGGIRVGKKDANSQQWYFFFKSYALNPVPGDTNLEANIGRGTKTLVYRKRREKGAGFP